MAKGRPRKSGKRFGCGKLRPEPCSDRGNDVVQARREAFSVFQGGKASEQIHDPIGRAWAAGLLDHPRFDGAMLRDIGRRYASLHERTFSATQVRLWSAERRSAKGNTKHEPILPDPLGERFATLDKLAKNAGSKSYLAMKKLALHDNPDSNPPWLDRLINARVSSRNQVEDRDGWILKKAVEALVFMVDGK